MEQILGDIELILSYEKSEIGQKRFIHSNGTINSYYECAESYMYLACVPALYGYLWLKSESAKSEENILVWISKTLSRLYSGFPNMVYLKNVYIALKFIQETFP